MKLNFSIHIPNLLDKIFTYPLLNYRLLRYGYPFRRIRLNEGKYTTVDPANFYPLNKYDWFCFGKDENLYAARLVRLKSGRLKILLMHRQIVFSLANRNLFTLSEQSESNGLVDHINTTSLDNRIANLRLATPSQNSCNSRRNKSNTYSKYRGVSFSKRKSKWFSAIRHNGRKIWLGYYHTEIDAALAYNKAAIKYHGAFARLNIIN